MRRDIHRSSVTPCVVLAASFIAVTAGQSDAAVPQAIFSTVAGSPTSEVPGLPGVRWLTGNLGSRIWRSNSGNYWTFSGSTTEAFGAPNSSMHILGSGMSYRTFLPVAVEAPFAPGTARAFSDFDTRPNDAGQVAVSINTTGPSANDQYLVRWNSVPDTYDIIAQEASPVPFVPSQTWGSSFSDPHILNDGTLAGRTSGAGGAPSGQSQFGFIGNTEIYRTSVTTPTGQVNGENRAFTSVFNFEVDATGANYMVNGQFVAGGGFPSRKFVAVNNAIAAEVGGTVAGYASPVNDIVRTFMTSNGDTYIRGNNADTVNWITRNGSLLVDTGDTVPDGSGETFQVGTFPFNATTFFYSTGNNIGDYVYGGVTSNPNPLLFAVIVFNGNQVIARHGDPVDLNGNGLFDDNTFIRKFIDDAIVLTDQREVIFTAQLRNAANTYVGDALIRLQIPAPSTAILYMAGSLALLSRRRQCND